MRSGANGRPPSAAESLDAYIYRLRKLLGHDRVLRQTGGYLLRVEPDELDVDRFEGLVDSARSVADAGDHAGAASALTEALALWRGAAWVDLLDDRSAAGAAERLEELRLSAVESRIEARLATGSGAELVPELEQLVREHPLRERLSALMIALYRAGRQTDALTRFTRRDDGSWRSSGSRPGRNCTRYSDRSSSTTRRSERHAASGRHLARPAAGRSRPRSPDCSRSER